jgi:PhnB protein
MSVKAKPDGYHSVTPYLIVDGAEEAIRWYSQALGAEEMLRLPMGDKIGHAEIRIGDSFVMLSDEWPDHGKLGPKTRGGATSSLMIYLEDADAAFDRAIAAGAIVERPVEDQFYGDRCYRSVRPQLDRLHPYRGRLRGGDAAPNGPVHPAGRAGARLNMKKAGRIRSGRPTEACGGGGGLRPCSSGCRRSAKNR